MKIKRISFYEKFKCLASACPDTCCKGWIIPLDDEAIALYHNQTGLLLLKLLLTEKKQNGIICFNKNSGVCPHLTKDSLCSLQKNHGERFLCEACRDYPRILNNYGLFAKECLDLSCPVSASLFLDNINNLRYCEADGDISYDLTVSNDDAEYLMLLEKIEDKLCDYIMDKSIPFQVVCKTLITWADKTQNEYITNPETDILKEDITFDNKEEFIIDALTTDRIVNSKYFKHNLKKTDPVLYKLYKHYAKSFDNLSINSANYKLQNCIISINEYYNDADSLLRGYLTYILRCCFLNLYEDYSFLKNILSAVVNTHMLSLFLYLYSNREKKLSKEDLIKVICAYDKRARHNPQIADEMYSITYEYYKKSSVLK